MNPPRLTNSYFLEDQIKNAPGGNRKSKAAKSNKAKGNDFEKQVVESFKRDGIKAKRNCQTRAGGGLGVSDVEIPGWKVECKKRHPLQIPAWWREFNSEHAAHVHKMLVIELDGEELAILRRGQLLNLAQDLIEAVGGDVSFP